MAIKSASRRPVDDSTITALALAMYRGKGQYALLLGSGLSTASGIPTGWNITLQLIRALPGAPKDADEGALTEWYRNEYGNEPNYSYLMGLLARSPSDRKNLLRRYIEPTEQEKQDGLKQPTAAHRAIARLVIDGYVRMIVTTNFDRLLERAIDDVGIVPDIISHPSQIAGTTPFVHSKCLILKLHGDYIDARLLNTAEELTEYSRNLRSYLASVLETFGLVVCGWSGEWDTALRNALRNCESRRYAMFWMSKGPLGEAAKEIVNQRGASVLPIESADGVFTQLAEAVESLGELELPDPLDIQVLIATTKRYLPNPISRIKLHDLIQEENKRATDLIISDSEFPLNCAVDFNSFKDRIRKYCQILERPLNVYSIVIAHGTAEQIDSLPHFLASLYDRKSISVNSFLLDLTRFPGLVASITLGFCAFIGGKFDLLHKILFEGEVVDWYTGKWEPRLPRLDPYSVITAEQYDQNLLLDQPLGVGQGTAKQFRPIEIFLEEGLRKYRLGVPINSNDSLLFEEFSGLLSMIFLHFKSDHNWVTFGRSHFLRQIAWEDSNIGRFVERQVKLGSKSPILLAGFFDGDPDKFAEIAEKLKTNMVRESQNWWRR